MTADLHATSTADRDARHSRIRVLRPDVAAQPVRERESGMWRPSLAHLSHELRTPIHTVLGYAALLNEGAGGALPPPAAEMVGRIARSARDLRALVEELLDLARLDAGGIRIALETVSLEALLRDAVASLEPVAQAARLTLDLRAADVPSVLTDAVRVRQIVLNLVTNAIKFTARGGVVVALEPRACQVAVHVTDTGVGITEADRERVFDEFVQVDAAHGGAGLGLAISRRLARLLGGELTLRSAPGVGSRFTLTLPLNRPAGAHGEEVDR